MKIYSWNVYCFNKHIDNACAFLRELDFDVMCLQEVTPELLVRLKEMPFHIMYHIDVIRLYSKDKIERNYVVILSRHEILKTGTQQFPELPFPLQTRLFIRFMSLLKWTWITERGFAYVDIMMEGKNIRVVCAHLTLWGPANRAREFEILANTLPQDSYSIVCGDFNVIEYGPLKVLNYLLGASIHESTPWYPERALFEERFNKYGLKNPLKGQITHHFSHSQLDHILVPQELAIKDALVVPDAHGSDHQPVGVEVLLRI